VTKIPGSKFIIEVIIKDLPEGACSHPSTPGPEEQEEVTIPTDRRVIDLKILRRVAKIVEIPINAFRANAGPGTQVAMPEVPGATCLQGVALVYKVWLLTGPSWLLTGPSCSSKRSTCPGRQIYVRSS